METHIAHSAHDFHSMNSSCLTSDRKKDIKAPTDRLLQHVHGEPSRAEMKVCFIIITKRNNNWRPTCSFLRQDAFLEAVSLTSQFEVSHKGSRSVSWLHPPHLKRHPRHVGTPASEKAELLLAHNTPWLHTMAVCASGVDAALWTLLVCEVL